MLDQLDEQLRAGARELRTQISGEPPALPAGSRRPIALVAAALLLVGAIGGALLVNQRQATGQGDRATAATSLQEVADPVPEGMTATSVAAGTDAPLATLVPPTTLYDDGFERVDEEALFDWIGKWTFDFQLADVYLGSTGDVDYSLEMTEASFCIRSDEGGNCMYTDDGRPLTEEPLRSGLAGSTGERWTATTIVPAGVELQFYASGVPACEMHAFPMTAYGDAVLWACENTTAVPASMEIAATRGERTVIALVDWLGSRSASDPGATSTAPPSTVLVDIATLPWPTDPWTATNLEQLIGVDPRRSIETYVERAEALTRTCMADEGFVYGMPLESDGAARQNGPITYQGQEVPNGCEGWANDLAFPGNHFANNYQSFRTQAANRPEFVSVLDEYSACLNSRGFDGVPQFDGLDDEAAQKLTDEFNNAATTCDQTTGLADAQRALEVLTQQALVLSDPDGVRAYAATLTSALELQGGDTE